MNRKVAGGLLVTFFILLALVILSLFMPLGGIEPAVYTFFIIELFFLFWFVSRKIKWKKRTNRKTKIY